MNICTPHLRRRPEAGQTTIAMVGVVILALLMALGIAIVGDAMIHRARARTAADTVGLAAAVSHDDAQSLRAWYSSQGIQVEVNQEAGRTTAHAFSGPSQAKAWATIAEQPVATSPALQAIVARVEQLRGVMFSSLAWRENAFVLGGEHATIMRAMQAEFLLCSEPIDTDRWQFEPC